MSVAPADLGGCVLDSTKPIFKGFTEKQLSDAFNAVVDPQDWRKPIKKTLPGFNCTRLPTYKGPWLTRREDLEVYKAAVEFYTSTVATTTEVTWGLQGTVGYTIEAVGYRAGPAGP